MRWVWGILLVTAAMAGCLGSETSDGGAGDDAGNEESAPGGSTGSAGGCDTASRTGNVAPMQPLSVQAEAEGAPASAKISGSSSGTGELNLSLVRDGETVWSDTRGGPGAVQDSEFSDQVFDLQAGTYTLTAASEDGVHNVTAQLAIAWGSGSC